MLECQQKLKKAENPPTTQEGVTNMQTTASNETLQSLRTLFPGHMPRMEAAATQDEFFKVHDELMADLRNRLRGALKSANMDESAFSELLEGSREGKVLAACVIDSTVHDSVINATGDAVREKVQTLFNGLDAVGKGQPSDSNALTAARLIANRLIAAGDKGVKGADDSLKKYAKMSAEEAAQINDEVQAALASLSDEEKAIVNSAAFAGATAAAMAGVTCSGGGAVVVIVILVIVAVLIPLIVFMCLEAACVMLVVNDLADPGLDYSKYKLVNGSSYNIHGKETGYTPEILSSIVIHEGNITYVFSTGGFYTTEKRDADLYGTKYGVKFDISGANKSVAFGIECPLNGDNKCYCGFDVSAETAADKVNNNMSCEATSGAFKAKITMASRSGRTAYYIARVYKP
jgi:predicted transcriptional regulator